MLQGVAVMALLCSWRPAPPGDTATHTSPSACLSSAHVSASALEDSACGQLPRTMEYAVRSNAEISKGSGDQGLNQGVGRSDGGPGRHHQRRGRAGAGHGL